MTLTKVECPICGKFFFEAWWVSTRVSIHIVCRCKRLIEIREDYTAHVLSDTARTPG